MQELTPDELRRYARHLIMPEVGRDGQLKLKRASVLIVGLGGLGSPAAYYLAAAGIGRIGLVDFDLVDETNLQRQILHFTSDVGNSKTDSALEKLRGINPFVEFVVFREALSSKNALDIVRGFDIAVDGTDNFATRYLVNDACVLTGKPNVYGSIFRFEGQVSVFWAEKGPCYRCLYPEPPPPGEVPNCAEAGVLGVLPGIVGCIQANEAIKLILGLGEPLIGHLLHFDALGMRFRRLEVGKDPACPICGEAATITELIDYEEFCGVKPSLGMNRGLPEVSVQELDDKRNNGEPFILLDIREPHELQVSRLEPSLHIPMHQVAGRLKELDKDAEILVLCRTGNRSAQITQVLLMQGFLGAKNVAGGINAYAEKIDPSLTAY
ncbi:MAG: molybdopterin-synthase adenylyltransferase MoeB [Armatimonadetes bacterium]|nr:molybdopterin-synthase adenylyltransferase MoeB [Armatimonadota bacterium]